MPNTTNFNWSTPADTDLVKNGASAIRTLGSAIDTSFVDLKGGTTGQVLKKTSGTDLDFEWGTASSGLTLINTTSFNAVSSVSLPADSFTSTYDNYRVIVSDFTGTNQDYAIMRLRASGSDNSTSNYYFRLDIRSSNPSGGSPDETRTGNATTSWANSLYVISSSKSAFAFEVYNPKASVRTQMTLLGAMDVNGVVYTAIQAGSFNATTSFDSLSVIANTGTITGKVSVYGYSK